MYLYKKGIFDDFDSFPNILKNDRIIFLENAFNINYLDLFFTKEIDLNECSKLLKEIINTLDNNVKANQKFTDVISRALGNIFSYMQDTTFQIPMIRSFSQFDEDEFHQIFNSLSLEHQYLISQILHLILSLKLPQDQFVLSDELPLLTITLMLDKIFKYFNPTLSFLLSSEYPYADINPRLRSFLSMISSKENKNLSFFSLKLSQDNQFGCNTIKVNLTSRMFGVRILSWYHDFFQILKQYLTDFCISSADKFKYLQLTGSPGIGKSTFIYYLVLRWILLREFDNISNPVFGMNLIYMDEISSFPEQILILKLGENLFLCKPDTIAIKTQYATIITKTSDLYYIIGNNATFVKENFNGKYNDFNFSVIIDSGSITINIEKPEGKTFQIFTILDGSETVQYKFDFNIFPKGLICTSYHPNVFKSKRYITYIAPTCTVNEFMNLLLLYNGGDKKRIIEMAKTIIQYINLNIRDTLLIADNYSYTSPDEYLIDQINIQLSGNNSEDNDPDYLNNKRYTFIICPENKTLVLSSYTSDKNFIHFTSNRARDIILSIKKQNALRNEEVIKNLLRNILNVDDPKIKGILFESYGHLELKLPCALNAYRATISTSSLSFLYDQKSNLCINFCARVEFIYNEDYKIDDFVTELKKPKKFTNYVFKPSNFSQPLYDALIFEYPKRHLYVIQMTVSPKHAFVGEELDNILDSFKKQKVRINKITYVHLRNYPLNEKRGFLTGKYKKYALKCIQTYKNLEIYYATLNIEYTVKIRRFYDEIQNKDLDEKNRLMIDKINNFLGL